MSETGGDRRILRKLTPEERMHRRAISQEERRRKVDRPGIRAQDALLLPNLFSISRLLLAVPAFVLIFAGHFGGPDRTAAILLLVAFVTDLFDGQIARSFRMKSDLGKVLDPVVDKIVVIGTAAALTFSGAEGILRPPVWLLIAIVVRDGVILAVASRALREDHHLFVSSWTGKVTTFGLAVTLLAFLLQDMVNETLLVVLPWIIIALLALSSVDYLEKYWSVKHKLYLKQAGQREADEE